MKAKYCSIRAWIPLRGRRLSLWVAVLLLLSACSNQPAPTSSEAIAVSVKAIAYPQNSQTLQPASKPNSSAQWMDFTDGNDLSAMLVARDGTIWSGGNGGIVQWDPLHGNYQKYTTAEGLPANAISALAQTPDGILWAGTRNGYIASYNGKSWKQYPFFVDETITAIVATADGTVWFGTNRGLLSYNGYSWIPYTAQNGLNVGEVNALLVDASEALWVATSTGLASFRQGQWQQYAFAAGQRFTSLAQTRDGTLWAGSYGQLYRLVGGKWQAIDFQQGPDYARIGRITAMAASPNGWLWFSTPGYLVSYDGHSWKAFHTREGEPLASLAIDPNGGLWAGGRGTGLAHLIGDKWKLYRTADGLSSNFILSLAAGGLNTAGLQGGLWVGSNRGAYHYNGKTWQTYSSTSELPDDQVLAITLAPDGSTWFGTQSGAVHLQAGRWVTYTVQSGYDMGKVANIAVAGDRSIWFATQQGAWHYDPGRDALVPVQGELPSSQVLYVAPSPDGNTWLLTAKGVTLVAGDRWLPVNFPDQEFITCMAVTPSGDLWLGTRGHGVYRLSADVWSQFSISQADSLTLNPDGSGYYQSGTMPTGLNGKYLQHFNHYDRLPDDTVNALAIEPNGTVWAGTDKGAGRFEEGIWKAFSLGSGLGVQEVQALAIAPNGAVWFGMTLGGVARFSPP